jgi:ketosteroid isomerase-like protein
MANGRALGDACPECDEVIMEARSSVLMVGISVLLASCATTSQRSANSRVEYSAAGEELRRASVEWDRSYNSGEVAKLAALYAEDAVSMPPNLPTLKGRRAVEADFQSFFSGNTGHHETTVDAIVMDGDLAIERAHYRLAYKPRAGGAEVVETGRHLECRRKIGGAWKIVIEIWNVDTPAGK